MSGWRRRTVVLVLAFALSAQAQPIGEHGLAIEQSDGTLVDTGVSRLIWQTKQISCSTQVSGAVLCEFASAITQADQRAAALVHAATGGL